MRDERTVFEIAAHKAPEGIRLELTGELDRSRAGAATAALAHLHPPHGTLTLDLAGLEFCDSAGLRTLIYIRDGAINAGWQFQIINPRPFIRRVLGVTGLIKRLNVVDDQPDSGR
jgi:anti-sigma B factor antagonist